MSADCLTRPQYVDRLYCELGRSRLPGSEADMVEVEDVEGSAGEKGVGVSRRRQHRLGSLEEAVGGEDSFAKTYRASGSRLSFRCRRDRQFALACSTAGTPFIEL